MKYRTLRSFILIAAALSIGYPRSTLAADPPAAQVAARQAIQAHLDSIQSIMIDYDAEFNYTPATPANPPAAGGAFIMPNGRTGFLRIKTGVENFSNRFSFLKGMSRYEHRPSKQTVDAEIAKAQG